MLASPLMHSFLFSSSGDLMLGLSQAMMYGHGPWFYSRTGRFFIYGFLNISFERDIRRHPSSMIVDEHGHEASMEVFGSQKHINSSNQHTLRSPQPILVTLHAGLTDSEAVTSSRIEQYCVIFCDHVRYIMSICGYMMGCCPHVSICVINCQETPPNALICEHFQAQCNFSNHPTPRPGYLSACSRLRFSCLFVRSRGREKRGCSPFAMA
jgi:hypothetical protein